MIKILLTCILLTGCATVESGSTKATVIYPMSASATTKGITAGPGRTAIGRVADQAGEIVEGLVR